MRFSVAENARARFSAAVEGGLRRKAADLGSCRNYGGSGGGSEGEGGFAGVTRRCAISSKRFSLNHAFNRMSTLRCPIQNGAEFYGRAIGFDIWSFVISLSSVPAFVDEKY